MKKAIIFLFVFVSTFVSAQHEAANDTTAHAAITERGKPAGAIAEMKIGKDGGSIISSDGKVELSIPGNAIAKKTTFSIQPITNIAPNGNGPAYRLEPSGIKFQKPLELVFHYTPEESADNMQLLMGIAMQDNQGRWFSLKEFSIDTVAKTLSGHISHFSDWSKFDAIKLYPSYARVKINKQLSMEIDLVENEDKELVPLMQDDLVPLVKRKIPWNSIWAANEVINGNSIVGNISPASKTHSTYKAPAKVPESNPVAVTAELKGISYKFKETVFKDLKLVSNILVYGNAYEVTMISSLKGYAGSVLGTVTYKDTGSFVVSIEGKEAKLIEKVNRNLPDKLDYQGQCTLRQLKPGSGNIHIMNRPNVKLTQSSLPAKPATIEISFSFAPTIFPLIQFTCPDRKGGTFTSTNAQANGMARMLAAFPRQLKFEAKEGEQIIEKIGEEGSDMFFQITANQVKEE